MSLDEQIKPVVEIFLQSFCNQQKKDELSFLYDFSAVTNLNGRLYHGRNIRDALALEWQPRKAEATSTSFLTTQEEWVIVLLTGCFKTEGGESAGTFSTALYLHIIPAGKFGIARLI